jgi:serine/threonine-protein kinase
VQQVGRYQILGELGSGAMGVVYKALDPAIGRTVAIKTIRLRDLTDPSERDRLRERLFREAQSAGILSHPNIVTIYDIMEADGLAYIFMEYVNGPTLEKMLKGPQTPDKESLLSILRQTAAALDYAHKKGIVHRDIKPANIMIHEDGAAKIADFGVAKIMSQNMTQAGTMMGTPNYMSPEQIQGSNISGRTDQFALAVISYEILTGSKPFVADHLPTLLFKIMRDRPLAPQRLNPTLHPDVERVFERAMAKAAERRFESCADFVKALAAACLTNPEWIPLPRGASEDMPTVASDDGPGRPKVSTTMIETVAVSSSAATQQDEQGPAPQASAEAAQAPAEAIVPLPEPEPQAPPPPATEPEPEPEPEPEEEPEPAVAKRADPAPIIFPPAREPGAARAPRRRARNLALAAAAVAMTGGAVYTLSNRPAQQAAGPVQEPVGAPEPAVTQLPPPAPAAPEVPPGEVPAAAPAPAAVKALPKAASAPVEAVFSLSSTPSGITAVFDDDAAASCTTPCEMTLASGRHTILLRKEGYRDARRIIEIPRETAARVELAQMTGTLSLITSPPGLTVFIDGREHAQKTPLSVRLPVGSHRVEAVRGNDRQQITVEITDGSITARSLSWQ